MSQRFSNGPDQPAYNFLSQRSSAHVSDPPPHGLPQPTLPPSHSLPPLTNHAYATANDHPAYAPRHASLITSQAEAAGQPGTFPVYAPTSNIYVHQNYGEETASTHAYARLQHAQSSRPPPMVMQTQPHIQPGLTATSRSLPEIAPMPARSDLNASSAYPNGQTLPPPEETGRPSHVVGAQGRRGILPSAAGRPPAVVGEDLNDQKAAPLPPKDADGKYPCRHCDKTYLHAKHLKRHLLRHTGVRPYTCGLCNDSFSRSDILKRHFNKCSSRRGNPTGQNHLAHSRASKAKEKQEAELLQEASSTGVDPSHITNGAQMNNGAHMTNSAHVTNGVQMTNGAQMTNYTPTSMESTFDLSNLNLNSPSYTSASNQVSRDNSVTRATRSTGSQSNRASLGMVSTSGYESAGYAHSTGHVTPDSITTSGAATPYTFPHEARTSQLNENGAFTHTTTGDLLYGALSRPPTSSGYSHGPLPHIVGQEPGPRYPLDWSHTHSYNPHEDYDSVQHQSGANTPFEPDKTEPNFQNIPLAHTSYPNQRTRDLL